MLSAAVQTDVVTVSEYSARLGRALRSVGSAVVEGEVQKATTTPRGMVFFELTDGDALLSCKIFPREAAALDHRPRKGDLVQVWVDRPDLYAERGALNLIVGQVRLAGEGELLRRRAALLERLFAEGLCDPARRRPLAAFPRAVGVIAGDRSDGMSDVIQALHDRWPTVYVVTCACVVQGKAAPRAVIDALARLQDHPQVDVIVLARGGGSVQDLACFDDEGLCRAIFGCEVPVVCAIGHTENNPVCNHVAWPAFTPSRSAELVVPSAREVRARLRGAGERVDAVPQRLELAGERLAGRAGQLDGLRALERRVAGLSDQAVALAWGARRLDELTQRVSRVAAELRCDVVRRRHVRCSELVSQTTEQLNAAVRRRLVAAERDVAHRGALVTAFDFRGRGWLLAGRNGRPLRAAADLRAGERIELHLQDGRAEARIEAVNSE